MVSVEEALHLVLQNQQEFGTEKVALLQSSGRILAQDVFADRDFPPYDRATMDGIAINSSSYNSGVRLFAIEKTQAAGDRQQQLTDATNCIEVMTGAVLPLKTDAVVPYELCDITADKATVKAEQVLPMQNVHRQGTDSKRGEVLVEKLQKVTPAIIGIMASAGLSQVAVLKLPKITICSTGDELVDVTEQPEDHKVRKSNVYMLAAALLIESIVADTIHLPDNRDRLVSEVSPLIKNNDVILFSGAVSKGKFDYLPEVLHQLGMQQIFHTVAQRPGKPFLFGKFSNGTLIFGFPGNPVSTFVCYHTFFKRWLHQAMHYREEKIYARLLSDVHFKPALSYHLLVKAYNDDGVFVAAPITGSTSGDLVTLTKATGILTLPADRDNFKAGKAFEYNSVI